jgi:capsular polysaccharide biosynthesis protein
MQGADTATIGQFAAVLRRRWRVLLLFVLLSVLLGALYVMVTPPQFTSRAVVKVDALIDDPLRSGDPADVSTVTEAKVVVSTSVAERAQIAMNSSERVSDLLDRVQVSSPVGSQVLEIRFAAADPVASAQGANAFARAYLDYRRDTAETRLKVRVDKFQAERALLVVASQEASTLLAPGGGAGAREAELRTLLTNNARQIELLDGQIGQLRAAEVVPGQVVDRGLPPPGDGRPSLAIVLPASLMLGLLLGTVAAMWRHRVDDRIGSESELETAAGSPAWATLRSAVPAARGRRAAGPSAVGYLRLASKVVGARCVQPGGLLVVAATPGSGDDVPHELALALAGTGLHVTIVRCSSHEVAGQEHLDNARLRAPSSARLFQPHPGGTVDVLDLGPEDAVAALLHRDAARLRGLLQRQDAFVVDAVNLESTSTVLALATLAPTALLLGERWHSTGAEVRQLCRDLEHVGGSVVAAALLDTAPEPRTPEDKDSKRRTPRHHDPVRQSDGQQAIDGLRRGRPVTQSGQPAYRPQP